MLFSGPMIRALLAQRKWQTRRIIKPQPDDDRQPLQSFAHGRAQYSWGNHRKGNGDLIWVEPRWQKGDVAWVRETWARVGSFDPGLLITRADYPACVPSGFENVPLASAVRWRPSIHMCRADSRITLHIKDHCIQRLNDISERDAIAEGIEPLRSGRGFYDPIEGHGVVRFGHYFDTAVEAYAHLWETINGKGAWARNPWVTVTAFATVFSNVSVLEPEGEQI